jgi:hypothetical protein
VQEMNDIEQNRFQLLAKGGVRGRASKNRKRKVNDRARKSAGMILGQTEVQDTSSGPCFG